MPRRWRRKTPTASARSSRSRSARGIRSFKLQDLNKHWWEITTASQRHYDEIFAKGDAGRRAS